jgi:hypothetical protein
MAEHTWNGGYELVSEGAYYARLISAAEKEGRIGHFPYNPSLPVRTGWDLGVDDYTAIWFVQDNGKVATVVDYYEAQGDGAEQIIAAAMPELFIPPPWSEEFVGWSMPRALEDIGRPVPFKYGEHYFPPDIRMREWGGGARSRVEVAQQLGLKTIRKGAATNPADRIQAVRDVLPLVRFNLTPMVEQGLKRLRRYRRKMNDALGVYQGPSHDENSHGADAFGEWAINSSLTPPAEAPKPDPIRAMLKPRTTAEVFGVVGEDFDDE